MGKWVICGAWPYVNAIPHLGTLIACVLSPDVVARYLRLKGEEVVFVSGSDEHGSPIEVEARRKNIPPKQLTDELHSYVVKLFKDFGVSYDNYTRTENQDHIEFVRNFFLKIYNNGYVYEEEVTLPYCPKCKIFLPDRFIEGTCPYCGYPNARGDQCESCGRLLDPLDLINPRCVLCGSEPEVRTTKHWFFDLPKLSDKLRDFVEKHPRFPDNVKNYCKAWFKEGLKPRAVTRDSSWGIPAPFPGSEGKTIYVWFEALLGYLSATLQYFKRKGETEKWLSFWKNPETKTVFFIGKDNIPFHAIILPAMLLASKEDYVLPWQISSIEFLMFEGQAFSKSRGIGVWLDEALKLLPPDYWRFALILMRPEVRDLNFTWKDFHKIVNSDLNDNLGNFIHRTLTFIYRYYKGKIPEPYDFDEEDEAFIGKIGEIPRKIGELIEGMRLKLAGEALLELPRYGNHYLNIKEPWHKVKEDPKTASTALWISVNAVKSLAILMEPFMPFSAEKLWTMLKLEGSVHTAHWDEASKLTLTPGHIIDRPTPLFRKLPSDFIEKIDEKLRDIRKSIDRPLLVR